MKSEENRKMHSPIWTIPNLLSLFRLCLIPLMIWLYRVRHAALWTGAVLVLSGVTDVADGYIARRYHMTSDVGKVLDPIADKVTQAAMLCGLLSRFPLMLAPLLLLLVKEIIVGSTGFLVIRRHGVVFGAKWHGKAATCLLYAMMFLHIVWPEIPAAVSALTIFACVAMMAVSLILYGIRNMGALRRSGKTA